MNKSNRVHARIHSLDNVFLIINLFYSLQSGSNGFITEGRRGSNFFQGVSKETDITCDFPGGGRGGSGPPYPPLDPHVGSTVCLQNHGLSKFKLTEKYHPKTTKWKKLSPAGRDSKCGSRGGSGVPPPENHKLWVSMEYKQLDPPGKSWTPPPPLENVGPPLDP